MWSFVPRLSLKNKRYVQIVDILIFDTAVSYIDKSNKTSDQLNNKLFLVTQNYKIKIVFLRNEYYYFQSSLMKKIRNAMHQPNISS